MVLEWPSILVDIVFVICSGVFLCWVNLVLGYSTILRGQYVATVAAHQPWELLKSSQPNPVRDLLGLTMNHFQK